MSTVTAERAFAAIEAAAADTEVRRIGPLAIGERLHQGDVYLVRVPDDWRRGKLLGTRQIAVGTTQGSRHIVTCDVAVYEGVDLPHDLKPFEGVAASEYLGPVVVFGSEGGVLTHPEHAHHECMSGVYQTTYQVDMDTLTRVRD